MKSEDSTVVNRLYIYFMALGTGVGIGNLWRFSYVATNSGGGAFFLLLMMMTLIVGVPLWVGEFILGKRSQKHIFEFFDESNQQKENNSLNLKIIKFYKFLSFTVSLMVLSYFSVVSGWVLHFMMRFVISYTSNNYLQPVEALDFLMNNGWLQVLLTSAHLFLVAFTVTRFLDKGFDHWFKRLIPVFLILLSFLIIRSLSFPGRWDAYRFYFYPDFSKINGMSFAYALGQVLFTFGTGFGLVSAMGRNNKISNVPNLGFRLGLISIIVSLVVGLLVFPLIYHGGGMSNPGPELLFKTVPLLFTSLDNGIFYGLIFFVCLYLATLSASIGMMQNLVSNCKKWYSMGNQKSSAMVIILSFVFSILPALSSNLFKDLTLFGHNLLVSLDFILFNLLLPLSALCLSYILTVSFKQKTLSSEFGINGDPVAGRIYVQWYFSVKYLAPILIVFGILCVVFDLIYNGYSYSFVQWVKNIH